MFGMGPQELIVIGVIAILLFGKNLPDVARKMGGSYREFRKGISDMKSSLDDHSDSYNTDYSGNYSEGAGYSGPDEAQAETYDDYEEATAPRFEPPPSEPQASDTATDDGGNEDESSSQSATD